jgi:hypothetical protein
MQAQDQFTIMMNILKFSPPESMDNTFLTFEHGVLYYEQNRNRVVPRVSPLKLDYILQHLRGDYAMRLRRLVGDQLDEYNELKRIDLPTATAMRVNFNAIHHDTIAAMCANTPYRVVVSYSNREPHILSACRRYLEEHQ